MLAQESWSPEGGEAALEDEDQAVPEHLKPKPEPPANGEAWVEPSGNGLCDVGTRGCHTCMCPASPGRDVPSGKRAEERTGLLPIDGRLREDPPQSQLEERGSSFNAPTLHTLFLFY